MELESCLVDAFNSGLRYSENKTKIELDATILAQKLKLSWFYNDNRPFLGSLTEAHGAYVGIFQKNIVVTDITHAELLVLIRKHATKRDGSPCNPYFHNNDETTELVRNILLSSSPTKPFEGKTKEETHQKFKNYKDKRIHEIIDFYGSILSNTIILDFNSTSFSFYVPPSLKLNIEHLISDSGYVHSIGNQVYVRKADRAVLTELGERIDTFLNDFECTKEKPVYITAYSSEFFNDEPGNSPVSMSHGLEGLKLSARKHHIEKYPVIEAIPALQENIGQGRLFAPASADYPKEIKNSGKDPRFTIFLMQDRSLVYSKTDRHLKVGSEIFLICYAQRLKNANPYHLFKESKPAWIEPVTLPHTLSSAHINIAAGRINGKKIVALDPFCGTGTALIDVGQRYKDATLIGFDRNPVSARLIKDNFHGFLSAPDKYCKMLSKMIDVSESFQSNSIDPTILRERYLHQISTPNTLFGHPSDEVKLQLIDGIAFVLGAICKSAASDALDSEGVPQFHNINLAHINGFLDGDGPFMGKFTEDMTYLDAINAIDLFENRFLIFLIWRSLFYNSYRFQGNLQNLGSALLSELNSAYLRFSDINSDHGLATATDEGVYEKWNGSFSPNVRLKMDNISMFVSEDNFLQDTDIISALKQPLSSSLYHFTVEDSIDTMTRMSENNCIRPNLIITDPPYGFNTEEDGSEALERMFSKLAMALCKIVDNDGVVAVTLPGQTKNGKRIPYFETRGMFVQQLLDSAYQLGRVVTSKASIIPDSSSFPRPAFRWNSDRGVSRHSLIFTVK